MLATDAKSYCLNLLHFHQWRQKSIIALLHRVNKDIFSLEIKGSFSSLYVILNHIVWAEKTWLGRVNHSEIANMKDLDAEGLMREWELTSARWENELMNSTVEDFERNITYYNTEGGKYENNLFEIYLHLTDHATYHIGQMMSAIRSFGLEPVPTNYIHYLRDNNKG